MKKNNTEHNEGHVAANEEEKKSNAIKICSGGRRKIMQQASEDTQSVDA